MMLSEIVKTLNLTARTGDISDREVKGGYSSDLMSDVLANAKSGDLWITNQKHQNCVAVASLLGLAGIIIAGGIRPDENTLEKAVEESVPVYTTDMSAYELAGKLYEMGVRA